MMHAICIAAAAPVRKEPSHRSELTNQLLFGETVMVLQQQAEWRLVRSIYDGYEGWVTDHLIEPVAETIATAPLHFIAATAVNAARYKGNLFQIPMGSVLPGWDEANRRLWHPDFTYEGVVRNVQQPADRDLFQNLIQQYWHAPYLWGGKTVMGVDCSGFVQTVFKVLGVPLLRDAYQQAGQGAAVASVDETTEGDLAFFNNDAGRITHVGIVLNDQKIIHASGTVHIDSLTRDGILHNSSGQLTHPLHSIRRVMVMK